jgi:hypothetical protein
MAFVLLKTLLRNEKVISDISIREHNAQTVQQLEDAVEFYKADLYVLDKQLEDYESLKSILDQYDCEYVVIQDDVKAVLPEIRKKIGVEEKDINLTKEKTDHIYYEQQPKERVVVQEKIIEKEVIRTKFQAIPSKVVVVGSLYRGAGSTTVSTNLARMIGERGIDVSYVEHPLIKPYMFDYLQIIAEEDKNYVDISREIQLEGLVRSKQEEWKQHEVKWHVIDSRHPQLSSFSYENMLVLSHAIQSNVLVVDISDRWLDPEIQKYLYLADIILLCLEPDPIKYDWSIYDHGANRTKEKMIMDFLNHNTKIAGYEIVNTKYNKAIDVKSWNQMLHKKPIAKLPYIPYEDSQKAVYQSKLLYDFGYQELFEEHFISLISKMIPKEYVEIKAPEKKLFKKMFKL